ncbi:MAG: DHH family phosphoesterase [Kiritimatiellae bacterium]|nr:DHH family phosphoesterase [Kiritimatiellia bacterium]
MDDALRAEVAQRLDALGGVLPGRGPVLIIPHNYPDPDALASAAGLQLLLRKRWGLRGQIAFSGAVSRAENKEMLQHFRFHWCFIRELRPEQGRLPALFVDTTPWSANVDVPDFVRPVGVFDHHPGGKRVREPSLFMGIIPGMGATATMVFEYLSAAGIAIPKWLASVMVYAIATETLDLSAETPARDLDAYARLLPRCNFRTIGEIRHAPLPRAYYEQLAQAMTNGRTYGRLAWSHLDGVAHPEIVPEIADLLLRMERITWAFCTGFMDDRLLVSIRSSKRKARCDRLLRKRMGRRGSAGGHDRMAAGYLDLGGLPAEERLARRDALVQRLVTAIEGHEPETVQPLVGK